MILSYNLDKIKFATDEATFQRAVGLYENGKVTEVEEWGGNYTAVVLGTRPYRVSVSARNYKHGSCTCYLGEKDTLCKHIVALAFHAVMGGRPLNDRDKELDYQVKCSRQQRVINKEELTVVKKAITEALRYIKPYSGPSRTWFANQDSLCEGCNRLAAIVSSLPVNKQAAEVLIKLLLRLDKKLTVGGVDDSNGIVWPFMRDVMQMLIEYSQIDPKCIEAFKPIRGIGITSFGWEEPLMSILDET